MKYLNLVLILTISIFTACQNASISETALAKNEIKQVSVKETNEVVSKGNVQFIDVRTVEEYADKHAPKAVNLPLDSIVKELAKFDKDKPVYLICQSGARSQKAAEILQKAEFKEIYNVKGGTSEWISAGLPTEK